MRAFKERKAHKGREVWRDIFIHQTFTDQLQCATNNYRHLGDINDATGKHPCHQELTC